MVARLINKDFKHGDYSLVPVRFDDILLIKKWRNEQMKILRQNVRLTNDDQKKYFRNIILPESRKKKPNLLLFSLLFKNKLVAYGGLTYIDWFSKRTELAFLADTKRGKNKLLYKKDFSVFIELIRKVTFETLKLHRIYTETFDVRPFHIKILETNGFKYEGTLKKHVIVDGIYVDSIMHGMIAENK